MRPWLVLCALLATAAIAAPRKPAVVLTGTAPLTRWVGAALSKRFTVSTAADLPPAPTAGEVRKVTGPGNAVALVLCQATGEMVTLQVLNGADGTPLETVTLLANLKRLPRALPRPSLDALLLALGKGQPPASAAPAAPKPEPAAEPARAAPEPAPKPAVTDAKPAVTDAKPAVTDAKPPPPVPAEPPAVTEASPDAPRPTPRPALRLSVGFGGFNRAFSWAGNPSPALASSLQPFSGAVSVEASWFPGAHVTSGVLAHVGLFGSADLGLGLVSRLQTARFSHEASRLRFGGLIRLPLGDRFTPFLHAGYARHLLSTSAAAVNDGTPRPNLPDVLFNGFRGGLGLRLRLFGSVELDALGGYHLVAFEGELGSERYFPDARAFGVDAGGGLSVGLGEALRLRAGAEWLRYFVTLNAGPTSTFFARSAADQYVTATVSLQWVM